MKADIRDIVMVCCVILFGIHHWRLSRLTGSHEQLMDIAVQQHEISEKLRLVSSNLAVRVRLLEMQQ